jgi:hypothetical protein
LPLTWTWFAEASHIVVKKKICPKKHIPKKTYSEKNICPKKITRKHTENKNKHTDKTNI